MGGRRPAEVVRGGRTGVSHSHAPVIAGRRECERINAAGERLGLAAELGVNPAQALFVEENAGVVAGSRVESIPLAPPAADANKERNTADRGIVLPALTEDP